MKSIKRRSEWMIQASFQKFAYISACWPIVTSITFITFKIGVNLSLKIITAKKVAILSPCRFTFRMPLNVLLSPSPIYFTQKILCFSKVLLSFKWQRQFPFYSHCLYDLWSTFLRVFIHRYCRPFTYFTNYTVGKGYFQSQQRPLFSNVFKLE